MCLAGVAGYVDAVGLIETRGSFVSFMSGNTTRLGVGIASLSPAAATAAGLERFPISLHRILSL